ncbi:MAG: hypothetical protein PHI38_10235 [Sulfurimonas sp.]|uniref:hypothetical protein n=1 Tax=Sulfurimonas sp. TaxID=2022749 RepID=UPI00262F6490|nr:hypothetical protein [Sulfurimonas sp.]MDD3477236.1 hypothetical protein [Sulfurimonas sp.]
MISEVDSLFKQGLSFNLISDDGECTSFSPKKNDSLLRDIKEPDYFADIINIKEINLGESKTVSRQEALLIILDDTDIEDDMRIMNEQ